jgi:hypothetical protein
MLTDVTSWKSLSITKNYPENVEYHYKYLNQVFNKWTKFKYIEYHYKYLNQVFNNWTKFNIFQKAYVQLLKNNYFKFNNVRKSKTLNLFIDTTFIVNKYGEEMITKHPEYKKKKVSKLSVICDDNNHILSVIPVHTSFNNDKKCNVFKHDVKSVQETIDNIKITIPKYIRTKLGGDKGYITQKKFTINNKFIKLIAPKRINQKTKNTTSEKKFLSKRYKVEISNANFKKSERLMLRKDKKIDTYMSFVYLSLLELFCTQNKLFKSP